ncbi:hypothetical protein F0726_01652 [Acidithiobacillus caldus]|nr:hypothetical protein F0726_01652 [Acidithiobacillus caldus]
MDLATLAVDALFNITGSYAPTIDPVRRIAYRNSPTA